MVWYVLAPYQDDISDWAWCLYWPFASGPCQDQQSISQRVWGKCKHVRWQYTICYWLGKIPPRCIPYFKVFTHFFLLYYSLIWPPSLISLPKCIIATFFWACKGGYIRKLNLDGQTYTSSLFYLHDKQVRAAPHRWPGQTDSGQSGFCFFVGVCGMVTQGWVDERDQAWCMVYLTLCKLSLFWSTYPFCQRKK